MRVGLDGCKILSRGGGGKSSGGGGGKSSIVTGET
jgi:hypothetical protein